MLVDSTQPALQRSFYDAYRHDPMVHRAHRRRMELTMAMLAKIRPGKLLDVGCSDGALTVFFRPFDLFGIDISPEMVRRAEQRGIRARCADASEGLPFEAHAFDVVFAGETLEHTVRTDFFLSECNRVLTPGGSLIITTPSVNSVASWLLMGLLDMPPYGAARYRSPHVRDFTKRSLTLAMRNSGFAMRELRGTWLGLPWPRRLEPVFGPLEAAIANVVPRIAAGVVLRAEKTADARFDPTTEIQPTLDSY
jgi:SAM-dependent methyltransferase